MAADTDVSYPPVERADSAFEATDINSCQVYGHLYEACVGLGCSDDDCRIRTCAHCGDVYEE